MRGRLGTLTALYVTQYLGIGFITVGLTAILRDGGTSLDTLALLQFVGLVWPIKFLWAPVIDRYGSRHRGHYRSWLVVLQGGMVLALLALLPFDRPAGQLGPVVAICVAYVFLSATQDIAVDRRRRPAALRALAGNRQRHPGRRELRRQPARRRRLRGRLRPVRLGARDPAARRPDRRRAAGGVAVPGTGAHRPRGQRRRGVPGAAVGAGPARLPVVDLRRGAPVYIGAGATYALVTPALVDADWSLARIGVVTGVVTSLPAIVAGLLAGAAIGRFGRGRVLVAGGVALALSTAMLLPLMNGRAPLAGTVAALCCFMAAYTIANVVLYTVNMDYSRPGTGGTDFTVLSSFGLVCSFVAASVALAAAEVFGYPVVAVAAVVLVALGVALGLGHQRRFRHRSGAAPGERELAKVPG